MTGSRFFVSLREVLNTERILTCRSPLKWNINFRVECLKPVQKNDNSKGLDILAQHESEIHELSLSIDSNEVAYTISRYIGKIIKRFQCEMYFLVMVGNGSDDATEKLYFDLLSRGGLTVQSSQIAEFVIVLLHLLMRLNSLQDITTPLKESQLKEFYELSFQNIFSLVSNTLKKDFILQQKLLWIYFTTTNKSLNRMKSENIP